MESKETIVESSRGEFMWEAKLIMKRRFIQTGLVIRKRHLSSLDGRIRKIKEFL